MTYERSTACYEKAACIPGRSLTRSKAPGRLYPVGSGPLYVKSGTGAVLTDVDGNEFIDMICGLGAISLGYQASFRSDLQGCYSLPSYLEGEAAEAVLETMAAWASSVRFVKTGSEATHAAYRIAKRATGRRHVLIGRDSYHGWAEWCQCKPDGTSEHPDTVLYEYGELASAAWLRGGDVAAVFVEPHRWVATPPGWLDALQRACAEAGTLLVYDDIIFGLRAAVGGSREYFGVQPDLACFGKALANGLSIGCVVGNEALRDYGELISGTFSGEVDALERVIDVLQVYGDQPVIEVLWARGAQLGEGLAAAIQVTGWDGEAFVEGTIRPHQRLRFADEAYGLKFAAQMAARGVLWHPMLANTCYAHSVEQIDRVIVAAAESLKALR